MATEIAESTLIVEMVSLDGTVNSLHTAALSVEIVGLVEAVLVQAGDGIAAGTPIFELNAGLERLSVASLEVDRREAVASREEVNRLLEEARTVGAARHIPRTEVRARAAGLKEAQARVGGPAANLEQRGVLARSVIQLLPFPGCGERAAR